MNRFHAEVQRPLHRFVQMGERLREILAQVPCKNEAADAEVQDAITVVAELEAAARPFVPAVLDEHGRHPVVHFVSTLFLPDNLAMVTKNDLILWTGTLANIGEAQARMNWPTGSTVHLSPASYALVLDVQKKAEAAND